MNFLIIEDDYFLSLKLKNIFEKQKSINNVKVINNYIEFLDEIFIINVYDIVLVDINLWNKNKNGFDIIKLIRNKDKEIPIIVISWSNDINFIDYAFEIWANDYMVKPFRPEELRVRIFKRFKSYFFNLKQIDENIINYNWLVYNIFENEFYFDWNKVELTKKNKYLLSIFLSNREKFLSTDFLVNKLWWNIDLTEFKNIRVYISRLKAILKKIWIENWINNVRWEWYIFKK